MPQLDQGTFSVQIVSLYFIFQSFRVLNEKISIPFILSLLYYRKRKLIFSVDNVVISKKERLVFRWRRYKDVYTLLQCFYNQLILNEKSFWFKNKSKSPYLYE